MDGTRQWFESEKEREVREHNEGQADGAKAGFLDELIHNNLGSTVCSKEYNEGYKNGVSNKPE